MASASGSKKRVKGKETSHSSKKQYTTNTITQAEEQEELQWVSNTGKSSFVWKFFQAKTDGRAYCRYIDNDDNKECGYSCIYKTQTSSMIYHINSIHKEYEKKSAEVCMIKPDLLHANILILNFILLAIKD